VAKVEVRMAIDPFHVIRRALGKSRKHTRVGKIVSVDYDEEADVLYAKFTQRKTVDSEPLDDDGMVVASLDSRQHMTGLTIMHASNLARSH